MQNQDEPTCLICKCHLSKELLRWGTRFFCERCNQYEIIETFEMKERGELVGRFKPNCS